MPYKFQRNLWRRSLQLEGPSEFSFGIVLEHRKRFALTRKERATSSNFRDKLILMFANFYHQGRLIIVLFFKRYSLGLEALSIAPSHALQSNDLSLDISELSFRQFWLKLLLHTFNVL